MIKHIKTIGPNSKRSLICQKELISETLLPGTLFLLEKILGRVELTEDLIHLVLDTFDNMQIYQFCDKVLEGCLPHLKDNEESPLFPSDAPDRNRIAYEIMDKKDSLSPVLKSKLSEILTQAFFDAHQGRQLSDKLQFRARELAEMTEISLEEGDLIYLLYLTLSNPGFNSVFHQKKGLEYFHSLFAFCLDSSFKKNKSQLSFTSSLISQGIIKINQGSDPYYSISPFYLKYFRNCHLSLEDNNQMKVLPKSSFDLKDFPLESEKIQVLKKIMTQPGSAQILLYGEEGTGKTELARCLVQAVGKEGRVLKIDGEEDASPEARRHSLILASGISSKKDQVLVIDEADSILNNESYDSEESEKNWIIEFMDNFPGKMIWISKKINRINLGISRRFSFNLGFPKFSTLQREKIWNTLIDKKGMNLHINRNQIQQLSRNYPIDAGGINTALNTVKKLLPEERPATEIIPSLLNQILTQQEQLITGKLHPTLKNIQKCYNPTFIHCKGNLSNLPSLFSSFSKNPRKTPLNLLFWGAPGTGKTEYVKYLAEKSAIPLHDRRASDLITSMVGETEANIAQIFSEAETESAILLLDEADSFFVKRSEARNSWDRTMTNELLVQMENFKGMLICCTNHLDLLDTAVLRRFSRKVEFLPPEASKLPELFQSFFPKCTLDQNQKECLCSLEGLTPGDFFTVQSTKIYEKSIPSVDLLLGELRDELRYHNRDIPQVMGF